MISKSNKLGTCIAGEVLRGIARKFNDFNNKNPIFKINNVGVKLDAHGGKNSICFINKKIRETKLDISEKEQVIVEAESILQKNTNPK